MAAIDDPAIEAGVEVLLFLSSLMEPAAAANCFSRHDHQSKPAWFASPWSRRMPRAFCEGVSIARATTRPGPAVKVIPFWVRLYCS